MDRRTSGRRAAEFVTEPVELAVGRCIRALRQGPALASIASTPGVSIGGPGQIEQGLVGVDAGSYRYSGLCRGSREPHPRCERTHARLQTESFE